MKHLASLAVLLTFAAVQVAFAEESPQDKAKRQAAKHAAPHGPSAAHNPQFSHKVGTTNLQNNPNVHVQSIHNTPRINPNWNKQIQNTSDARITNNPNWKNNPKWTNNPKWQNNPNWKNNVNFRSKNWWNANPQWQANHAKWANYRRWDRDRHDRAWWSSRYDRFAVFGGGYYYWNNGFWYPAYGYDPTFSTYSYNAPIYAYNDQEPAQVVADVQNALGQAGYDPGPVDNTYGPQTRDALLRYQSDNGLRPTGEIDEATLASLGLE